MPGFDPAVVVLPPQPGLRPLVLAAHGAGDSPEAFCDALETMLGGLGVLVCVAGRRLAPSEEGRYFPEHHTLQKVVLAARDAALAAYPDELLARDGLFIGYSQGATMGVLMLPAHGAAFPHLALLEGGTEGWTARAAAAFRASGGRRVLFVCGRASCEAGARRAAPVLTRAGVAARVEHRVGAGHRYDGAVGDALAGAVGWLTAGAAPSPR